MSNLQSAFEKLRANAPAMAAHDAQWRTEKIRQLYQAVYDRFDQVYDAGCKEVHYDLMGAAGNILMLKSVADDGIAHLAEWMQPELLPDAPSFMGKKAWIQYEPKGTLLHLSTWNAPVLTSLKGVISAVAAGNTVMLKPSELAPHSAEVVREIVQAVFADNEVCVVTGGPEVAQELLTFPFDHISYVGNNHVGRMVMKAAAEHFASVTLEMGGKNPVIVDASADIEDAAVKVINGRMTNCGQGCVCPDYVLVQRSVFEPMVAAMARAIEAQFNPEGKGIQQCSSFSRIINDRHVQRIKGYLDDARARGAQFVCGGEVDEEARYIAPTILTDVNDEMIITREEIFGPIICVLPFDAPEDAIAKISKSTKPLASYIFAQDRAAIDYYLSQTRSGTTAINNCVIQAGHPTLPFGGSNHSGIGRINGFRGFQEFSNARSIMEDPMTAPPSVPPFPEGTGQFLVQMLKP